VRFEVLGDVRASHDGRELALGGAKSRLLLATLLAQPNRAVSVDVLVDSLWEDAAPASASGTLRWHVHQLRARLDHPDRIAAAESGYAIRVEPEELDSLEFEELLGAAQPDDTPLETLETALGLWRGPAFGGLAAQRGTRFEARRLEQSRVEAQERRAAAALELGRHAELVAELAELVRRHPVRERFRAQLMLALYRSGRRADALGEYRAARECLVNELGLEPSAELRDLERAILCDDPSLGLAPAAARAPTPAELPADAPAFTGRGPELAMVEERLVGAGPSVVAIDGVGGMGKSTVAIHAAHRVKHRFPDGQLYINLHGATPDAKPLDPTESLSYLLRSLGAGDAAKLTNVEEMANRFRSLTADRRLLLLLDDARDAAQVRHLLPSGDGCAVLITSRRRLVTVPGVRLVSLDRLSPTDSRRLLDHLAPVDRGDSSSDRDRLVEWCHGLPLALTICAARLSEEPHRSVAGLVKRLADTRHRLSELAIDDLALRATFQMSYDELDAAAARLFRLVGLHDGADVSLEVAAALADASEADTQRLLERLIRARLVEEHSEGRYHSHDLLRLYARELVDATETEEERGHALRRMYVRYCVTARACSRVTVPSATGPFNYGPALDEYETHIDAREDALTWVDAETSNIRAVTLSCPPLGDLPAMTASIGIALRHILDDFRSVRDALSQSEALIVAMDRSGDPRLQSVAYAGLGYQLKRMGRLLEAKNVLLRARTHFRSAGLPPSIGPAVYGNNLAMVCRRLGELDTAEHFANESLALSTEAEIWDSVSLAWIQKGFIHEAKGDVGKAIEAMRQASEAAGRVDAYYNVIAAICNIGNFYRRASDLGEARSHFQQALERIQEFGYLGTTIHAECLWGLAKVYYDAGEQTHARLMWTDAADVLFERDEITRDEHAEILTTTPPREPTAVTWH
jgi:DNA-binding SARP family transcriptional activator